MRMSLIIPCFNEAPNLSLLLNRCSQSFANQPDCELILVDNGSTDDTAVVLSRELPKYSFARSVRVEVNRGYGFGILQGLKAADADVLAWTHADMQTDPADALRGFELFQAAGDPNRLFVKGRRYGRPAADIVFTAGMAVFETLLLRTSLWDINAQPTMFSKSFFNSWTNPPHDFSLDLFAYWNAKQQQLEIQRIPVLFSKRVHGQSSWNVNWSGKKKFIQRTVDYSLKLRRELHRTI